MEVFEISNAVKENANKKTTVLADTYREISWTIKCFFSFIIWKPSKMHLVFLLKEITFNFFQLPET